MNTGSDLILSGVGTVNGGKYNRVIISGIREINGDLEAEQIDISGSWVFKGDVITAGFNGSGLGTVEGRMEVGIIEGSGSFKVNGPVKASCLRSSGSCQIGGQLKAGQVFSSGSLSVGADVEAEEFDAGGSFKIDGLLNANRINIRIGRFCYAREIGGEDIYASTHKVYWHGIFKSWFTGFWNDRTWGTNKLHAELIEGTNVSLEHTHAKIVRGNRVKIGPGCQIELVEYTDSLEIDPESSVVQQVKSPREAGVSGTNSAGSVPEESGSVTNSEPVRNCAQTFFEQMENEVPHHWGRHFGEWGKRLRLGPGMSYQWPALWLPIINVRFKGEPDHFPKVAIGLVAVGDIAIGLVSAGGLAVGIVAAGGIGLGALAFGGVALGWFLALGGVAVSWWAVAGGVAVSNMVSIGAIAVGRFALGAIAIARTAVGAIAIGRTALGVIVVGAHGWGLIPLTSDVFKSLRHLFD
jgi:cytoskeletal protein CcmA (bactofilin family)